MPAPGPVPRTGLAGPPAGAVAPTRTEHGAPRVPRPVRRLARGADEDRVPGARRPPGPGRGTARHGGPAADARHSAGPPGGPVVPSGSARRGPPRAGRAGRASGYRSGELDGPEGFAGPPVAYGERPRAASGRVPVPGVGPASPRPGPRRPEAVPSARSACRCPAGDGYRPAVPEGPSAGAKGGRPRSAGPRPRWRARTTVRARRRPGGRGAKSRLGAGGLTHRSPAEPASGTGVDRSLTPAGSIALIALPSLRKRFGNAYENYCTANTSAGFRVPGIGANPRPTA